MIPQYLLLVLSVTSVLADTTLLTGHGRRILSGDGGPANPFNGPDFGAIALLAKAQAAYDNRAEVVFSVTEKLQSRSTPEELKRRPAKMEGGNVDSMSILDNCPSSPLDPSSNQPLYGNATSEHPCFSGACKMGKSSSACKQQVFDFCCDPSASDRCDPSAAMLELRQQTQCAPQSCTNFFWNDNSGGTNQNDADWDGCYFDNQTVCDSCAWDTWMIFESYAYDGCSHNPFCLKNRVLEYNSENSLGNRRLSSLLHNHAIWSWKRHAVHNRVLQGSNCSGYDSYQPVFENLAPIFQECMNFSTTDQDLNDCNVSTGLFNNCQTQIDQLQLDDMECFSMIQMSFNGSYNDFSAAWDTGDLGAPSEEAFNSVNAANHFVSEYLNPCQRSGANSNSSCNPEFNNCGCNDPNGCGHGGDQSFGGFCSNVTDFQMGFEFMVPVFTSCMNFSTENVNLQNCSVASELFMGCFNGLNQNPHDMDCFVPHLLQYNGSYSNFQAAWQTNISSVPDQNNFDIVMNSLGFAMQYVMPCEEKCNDPNGCDSNCSGDNCNNHCNDPNGCGNSCTGGDCNNDCNDPNGCGNTCVQDEMAAMMNAFASNDVFSCYALTSEEPTCNDLISCVQIIGSITNSGGVQLNENCFGAVASGAQYQWSSQEQIDQYDWMHRVISVGMACSGDNGGGDSTDWDYYTTCDANRDGCGTGCCDVDMSYFGASGTDAFECGQLAMAVEEYERKDTVMRCLRAKCGGGGDKCFATGGLFGNPAWDENDSRNQGSQSVGTCIAAIHDNCATNPTSPKCKLACPFTRCNGDACPCEESTCQAYYDADFNTLKSCKPFFDSVKRDYVTQGFCIPRVNGQGLTLSSKVWQTLLLQEMSSYLMLL